MAAVRIYFKKQIRVDHLTLKQYDMFKIGTVGLAQVKDRVTRAQNENDTSAKPLTRRYAIFKSKLRNLGGRGTNRRDLTLTGAMIENFKVRTVTDMKARAGLTSRKERIKGLANNKIERWVAFSPKNRVKVVEAARAIIYQAKSVLLK